MAGARSSLFLVAHAVAGFVVIFASMMSRISLGLFFTHGVGYKIGNILPDPKPRGQVVHN